jgi:hypothetical protein
MVSAGIIFNDFKTDSHILVFNFRIDFELLNRN